MLFIHSLTHLAVIIDKSSHSKKEHCLFFESLVQFNTIPNDFSELVSVVDLFLFLIISVFIHVYLIGYIRLFSFFKKAAKKHETENMQLVNLSKRVE